MIALEVHINWKKPCLAGIAGDGVVSAHNTWLGQGRAEHGLLKEDVSSRVGGLDSAKGEHMDWLDRGLTIGGAVLVRIVDAHKIDAPLKHSRRPIGDSKRRQKSYVRRMAKQFGWKIQVK